MNDKFFCSNISMAICLITSLAYAIPVQAAENEITDVTRTGRQETVITYELLPEFTVTIPKTVELSQESKTASYSIGVKGDMSAGSFVTVEPQDDIADTDGINFYMSEEVSGSTSKADVVATVTQADTVWQSAEVTKEGTFKNGSISAMDLSSGHWTGNLTFNINTGGLSADIMSAGALYDADDNIVATYGQLLEYGFDPTVDDSRLLSVITEHPELSNATRLVLPDIVNRIGNNVFKDCSGLVEITIPDSITEIGKESFNNCTGLTSIYIPKSITTIVGYAFYNCTSLQIYTDSLDGSEWDSHALSGCKRLVYNMSRSEYEFFTNIDAHMNGTELIIPDGVVTIPQNAFFKNESITSVVMPDSVESIGRSAFSQCSSLSTVKLSDNLKIIDQEAFYYSGLTEITIPDSVETINAKAFYNTKLTYVKLPANLKVINPGVFEFCNITGTLVIPDSVTIIAQDAFYYCSRIDNLIVPDTVTGIGPNAFYNVKNVTYNGPATGSPWGAKAINGVAVSQ